MAKTPKTPAQGGKVIGGYYKLPQGKNAKGKKTVGYQHGGAFQRSYQNQHHMRTGHFGSDADAKVYAGHQRKALYASAGSLGVVALSQHANHGASTAGLVPAVGLLGYAHYHDHKGRQMMNKNTGTKSSALWGFHKKK